MSTIVKRGQIPLEHWETYLNLNVGVTVAVMEISDHAVAVQGINAHGYPQSFGSSIPMAYFIDRPKQGDMFEMVDGGVIVDFHPSGYRPVGENTFLCYDRNGFYEAYREWGGDQDHIEEPGTYPAEVRFMVDVMRRIGYQSTSIPDLANWFRRHECR